MNKNIKFLGLLLGILLVTSVQAFALQCQTGRDIGGSSDLCYSSVQVASNETTLVSVGTVLVYDIANAQVNSANAAYQVRVSTASSNGIFVAGVAQTNVSSGNSTLVLVRGYGDLAVNTSDAITSGAAVWVGASGNVTTTSTTTQEQVGYVLENQSGGQPGRTTKKAYITIV